MKRYEHIEAVICPVIEALGYQFFGLEFSPQGKHSVLRVYIDTQTHNIGLDDCARASRQMGAVLDVEDIIRGEYTLEVSSPGLDKLLFTKEQMHAEIGNIVSVSIQSPLSGRQRFKGILVSADAEKIKMMVKDQEILFLFSNVEKARVVPKWEA